MTAGAIRTHSTAPPAGGSSTGNQKASGMTPQRGGRGKEAALSSAALARADLLSSASENDFLSAWSDDHHRDERVAAWRVFDSTAAEWVHTTVLNHRARHSPATATRGAQCVMAGSASSAAAGQVEDIGSVSLTPAAKSAIEEVFDRYDRSKAGRGFLLRIEVSALQEVWTRPDAEPPPPRRLPKPKSACQTSPQVLTTAATYHGRSAVSSGSRAPLEVSQARGNDCLDKRVLTRPAFVEFCRRAAARDAIFIRHFFTRSGYDYRLELIVPPIETAAEPVVSPARRRKGSVSSERRKSTHSDHIAGGNYPVQLTGRGSRQGSRSHTRLRRGGSLGDDGGGSGGKGIESPTSPPAATLQDRGLFERENDDDFWHLASGGLVDPAELWMWTEDERDHGKRENLDGVLSRGGGARVSRTGTTAIFGAFANTKGPCSATTTTPRKDSAGNTPITPTQFNEPSGTRAGKEASISYLPEPNMAENAESTSIYGAQKGEVDTGTPVRGAAPPGGALTVGIGGSTVASGRPPAQCEWCGDLVVKGDQASHSAAFCDENVVCVRKAR